MSLARAFWDFVRARKMWFVPPMVLLLIAIAVGLLILNASVPEVPRLIYPQT
jgi:hypothetical protein